MHDKELAMKRLADEIKRCTKCKLHISRRSPVVGRGSIYAKVALIGEAPGYHEDLQGLPFVGAAGRLLNQILSSLGFAEEDVYITNVVKCRPPENRDPEPDEIASCAPYLDEQLKIVSPMVVATLGRHSTNYIFSKMGWSFSSIERARGRARAGRMFGINVTVVPTYHPAAALYNPGLKSKLEQDLRLVKQELTKPRLL